MPTTKEVRSPDLVQEMMFDYRMAAKSAKISTKTLQNIEREVKKEFPNDPMLMELHILRAINAYSSQRTRKKKR